MVADEAQTDYCGKNYVLAGGFLYFTIHFG